MPLVILGVLAAVLLYVAGWLHGSRADAADPCRDLRYPEPALPRPASPPAPAPRAPFVPAAATKRFVPAEAPAPWSPPGRPAPGGVAPAVGRAAVPVGARNS